MDWIALLLLLFAWWRLGRRIKTLETTRERLEQQVGLLTQRIYSLEQAQPPVQAAPEPAATPAPEPHPAALPQSEPPIEIEEPVPETPAAPPRSAEPEAEPEPVAPSLGGAIRDQLKGREWEELIGGSWLNAIGVLVLVVGVALFLGYALTQFGPLGKVSIGAGVGVAMLAGGIWASRSERYVRLGRGAIAGGWSILYFTAFAMHALPAARVIESPWLGAQLLLVVATAIIAHSLTYRSQAATLLAFFSAYLALQVTSLSAMSVGATIPLTIALLAVSRVLGWPNVALAGMLLAYFTFAFRYDAQQVAGATGAAALICYWLSFEIYDLMSLRRDEPRGWREAGLFPLNATLFIGISLMVLPPSTPVDASNFLAICGALFLASTVLRLRWRPAAIPQPATFAHYAEQAHNLAILIAALLFAGAIGKRFPLLRSEIGLLLEAQLLVFAGLRYGLRFFTPVGAVIFAIAGVRFFALDPLNAMLGFGMAAQLYLNRRLVRTSWWFSWAATLFLLVAIGEVTHGVWTGTLFVAVAVGLLEAYLRLGLREFGWQSYLIVAGGFFGLSNAMESIAGDRLWEAALAGVLSAALLYAGAFRLSRANTPHSPSAGLLTLPATLLVALAIWIYVPPVDIAPLYALLGLALIESGLAGSSAWLRRQGLLLTYAAAGMAIYANMPALTESFGISHRLWTVTPVVVLCWHLSRRVQGALPILDLYLARGCSWLGTFVAVALLRFELGRTLAVLGWAALLIGLVEVALRRKWRDGMWQAYLLAGAIFARGWATNFASPELLAGFSTRILTGILVVAALYCVEFRLPADHRYARPAMSLFATALLSILLAYEVSGRMLTIYWGVQGTVILMGGFFFNERILRLSGLGLLFLCVGKLFAYDLRELDTLSRILSFIVLGLVMIGASALYMRFREKLHRYL